MKKLLVVLFCLPIIILGKCVEVKNIFGEKIDLNSDKTNDLANIFTLSENNLREPGKTDERGTWSFEDGVLAVKLHLTYYLDLTSGYTNEGYVKKTWARNGEGKIVKSSYSKWKKFGFSQNIFYSYNSCINNFVNNKMKLWEIKGEFEKTVAFQERVNEASRKVAKENFLNEAIEFYRQEAINSVRPTHISLKAYNADEETFLVDIIGYESFDLPVPISVAPKFKENFDSSNFTDLDLIFKDNKFIISNFEIDGHTYSIRKNVKYDANGMPIE